MELCNILNGREDWQEETFERIKRNLVSYHWNPQFKNASDHPIVTIYSEPQIGKTTLILTMIGLKEDQIQNVYDTLRGGIQKGNSSTATATIYQKSANDCYGFSATSIEDVADFKEQIEYCEEIEVQHKIEEIRKSVENDQADEGEIQHIYIPAKYFKDEEEAEALTIIDMPGVRSRNNKEEAHVKKLMAKYIPLASVCIMACNAMQFVGMQSEKLPNQVNWKMRDDKFIIVTTKSYIADTTKSYFKQDRSQRKQTFYDYIKESTEQLFKDGQFLPQNSKMEIYPLDLGESFHKLCENEIKDKEDVEELKEARNRLLRELRASILNHKGNKLKAAVKELRESVSQYGKEEENKICREIQRLENIIRYEGDYVENLEKFLKEIRAKQEYENVDQGEDVLANVIDQIEAIDLKSICDIFWNDMSSGREDKNNSVKIKNKNIENIRKELIYQLNVEIDIQTDNKKKIINYLEDVYFEIRKKNFSEEIRKIQEYMFLKVQDEVGIIFGKKLLRSLKINAFQWDFMVKNLEEDLEKELGKLKKKLEHVINKIQQEKSNEITATNYRIEKWNWQIEQSRKEIEEKINEKQNLEDNRKKLASIRKSNMNTIDMYKKTANATFREYRDKVVNKINDLSVQADEKMGYVMLLGLLDKDYSMIIGGIDDEGN